MYGQKLDKVSKTGVGCLHLAVQNDKIDMVKQLVNKHSLDPELPTTVSKKRPIHIAALSGSI